MEEAKQNKII